MTVRAANEVHYSPYDIELNADPYPTLRRLRDETPLYYNAERTRPVSIVHCWWSSMPTSNANGLASNSASAAGSWTSRNFGTQTAAATSASKWASSIRRSGSPFRATGRRNTLSANDCDHTRQLPLLRRNSRRLSKGPWVRDCLPPPSL